MVIISGTITVRLDDGTVKTYDADQAEITSYLEGSPFIKSLAYSYLGRLASRTPKAASADRGTGK